MKKQLLLILLTILFSFIYSQEICDNGIDDDGDGLIDLNDIQECSCEGYGVNEDLTSMIPNHSFEEYTSLPYASAQMSHAVGWVQASSATSDYFNINGSYGNNEINQMLPLPDGDGVVGTYVELLDNSSYMEYVGTCLNSPLLAGEDYELIFDIGITSFTSTQSVSQTCADVSYPDIEMTVYGTSNCANLPFSGVECPIGQADWQVIGTAVYSPIMNTWSSLTIDINTSVDIYAIAIGAPCVLPQGYYPSYYICNAYMFFDDLELNLAQPAGISIEHMGDVCEDNNVLIAHPDSIAGDYQWFLNGVAISGQTDTIIEISANNMPSGTYTIMQTIDTVCATSDIEIIMGETPEASFTYDINCVNTGSDFTDISTVNSGSITGWAWDFGDGISSTLQNPSHTFESGGTFDINLTVSTDLGCMDDTTITIFSPILEIDTSTVNVSCYNGNNGSIDVEITTGTAPFSYIWSNGEVTQDIDSLSSNNYTVTVQDDVGCQVIESFIIAQPDSITIGSQVQNVSCFNLSDGAINLTVTGGTEPYSYSWENISQVTEDVTGLALGTYTVTVSDANNCTSNHTVNISQPELLESSTISTDITCFGSHNGAIDLEVLGGLPPYTYTWSNNQHVQDIDNLSANTYHVTVEDANDCITIDSGIVSEPSEISITSASNTILCFGDETGMIDIEVLGGISPYTYNWNNNNFTEDLENMPAGLYTITVTDASGCTKERTIELYESEKIEMDIADAHTICKNTDYTLVVSVTGGVSPYTYLWNTQDLTAEININIDQPEDYFITVTDQNNCTTNMSVSVDVYDDVDLYASISDDSICSGSSYELSAIISKEEPLASQLYLNGELSSFPLQSIATEDQQFYIQMENQCQSLDTTIYLHVYQYPEPQIVADDLSGCAPFIPQLEVLFATGSQIEWSFEDHQVVNYNQGYFVEHEFTESGVHDIRLNILTQEGCVIEKFYNDKINVYPEPTADFDVDEEVKELFDPTIHTFNQSGDNNVNYWNFGDGTTSNSINPVHGYTTAGTYTIGLQVENSHGCTDYTERVITIENICLLWVPSAFSPDGDDINDLMKIKSTGVLEDGYRFMVYDRWGEPIFTTTNINEFWDGKAKGGKYCVQNGQYAWMIAYKDFNNVEHTKAGMVTVIK